MDPKTLHSNHELSDADRMHIAAVFHEEIAPRLTFMAARNGNLNCAFAGPEYENWVVEFRSVASGFEIVEFEYDEESRLVNLPPRPQPYQGTNRA
ncbi:MAG: hypothetical protein K9M96_02870 [Deltaproteobacteria bacterium]|nr:hypothetical protein [Deltaproteobacteria bacterium]